MEVTVKGSNMIFPAQHSPKVTHWISNLDMVQATVHVPLLFFDKPYGTPQPQVLKEALSKTLVPFYPMAGRLGCDENGRFQITCNAEGVLWIEAETSSVIDDLAGFTPCSQLQKFPHLIALEIPLRTRFLWPSYTLHTVCDGTTVLHFISSWSEMARGLSQISMPALIDRTLLRARVPPTPRFHHLEYNPPPSLLGPNNPTPSSVSVFKITQNQLNTLKAKSWEHENKTNYSIYTILAAYIWRCATKARGLSYDQPTRLLMPTNGRPRLHPPLPSSYLGNARMDNEYLRSVIDYLETLPDIKAARGKPETYQCPSLFINKWSRLPLHDADFCWGRPLYTGPANVISEGKIFIMPSTTDDGSLSLVACLQTPHMKPFEEHLYQGLMSFDNKKARY
ncbi:hypothetical protein CXB51_013062 [Gossypium anomalum]|uniref:Shikimate O-hydroxycinnamoyltransferase n=1 Tax=Gossypium anomalum TaxID=47600 RepID=A0A8J5ZAL9_9ROSI|nr:hypothetical protein CXB51_013062 [Gossypium anomalum]